MTRRDEHRIHLNFETNDIHWIGVETGKTTLVSRNNPEGILALHVAGHGYWNGIGMPRAYMSARFQVHKFRSNGIMDDGKEELMIEDLWGIVEFPARLNKDEGKYIE